MRICICGGGNLGHVMAGFLAAQPGNEVTLLTRRPGQWHRELVIDTPDGSLMRGTLAGIYDNAPQAVAGADIVLLCLPGYSISEVLLQIKDSVAPQTAVGSVVSSTGFFFEAMKVLPPQVTLFGFQRVPFIARMTEYGHRASLLGYKEQLNVAIERCDGKELLRQQLEAVLHTPVSLLGSYYEASLSNSNPLLHPARLYSLWKDWHEGVVYPRVPLFYEEWSEEASELYMALDGELHELTSALGMAQGSIATALEYYESHDAPSLAEKLRSIEAFKGLKAPMEAVPGGFVPNFKSRYFTEDFPYGLGIVRRLLHENGICSPVTDMICGWGMDQLMIS